MTGREILKKTLILINEYGENGEEWQYDTEILEKRAPTLINMSAMLVDELDSLIKGKRYKPNEHLPAQIKILEDEVILHPYITMGVLPYKKLYKQYSD